MPWFRQWAVNEQEAVELRSFELSVIPGLLQTEAYARALLTGGRLFTPEEVDQHVATRLARQEILTRDKPPLYTAVIDERVLHQPVGGPAVMREQLLHIAKLCSEHPRIRVQVVPTSVGAYAGLNGPFVMATLPSSGQLVFLDDQLDGRLVEREVDVVAVRIWDTIRGEALSYQQSIELIVKAAESWK
ncbi:DUF5753 domain-containing protein [Plantactinospora sp. B24E8]|uniref:DUF5753 domain-containing protein n=1 Tax=Plantactinospora sp. B24E8 TaxID=3153567 RepID=UPI00325DD202